MSFLARLTAPIVWRIPGHAARKIYSFARAEEGSRIDLLQAAQLTDSPARRALYLRHALDETQHAAMFARTTNRLRRERGRAPMPPPAADTEQLFERLGEIGFLAFVHRGERRGRRQFEIYRDHFRRRGDERTAALFETILDDERRHERYTGELLAELAGGPIPAARALRKAGRWEAWRTWRRAGRWLSEKVYVATMTVLYVAIAPMALLVRVVRPVKKGWH
jgi:rubrerythrin